MRKVYEYFFALVCVVSMLSIIWVCYNGGNYFRVETDKKNYAIKKAAVELRNDALDLINGANSMVLELKKINSPQVNHVLQMYIGDNKSINVPSLNVLTKELD